MIVKICIKFFLSVLFFLFLIFVSCKTRQDNSVYFESQLAEAMLVGKVITEEGLPLEGVKVFLSASLSSVTDISGRFMFKFINFGDYNLKFFKEGYLQEEYKFSHSFKERKNIPFIKVKMLSLNYLINEGYEYLKERKIDEVQETITKLTRIEPTNEAVLYLKAVLFFDTGKFQDAMEIMEKLRYTDRNNQYYKLTLIKIYEKLSLFEKQAALSKYLALSDPRAYYVYFKAAYDIYKNKLNNQKESDECIEQFNKYNQRYGVTNK